MTFAAEGASVIVADLDSQSALVVERSINTEGGNARAVEVDVSVRSSVCRMVEVAIGEFGTIDILVNNAGVLFLGRTKLDAILGLSEDEWDLMMNVNLKGAFLCCQAVLPHILERGEGTVLNLASTSARIGGGKGWVSYPAAKGGVVSLTIDLANKLAPHGIRVNAIAPGYIETDLTKDYTPQEKLLFAQRCPMGRGGRPDEVAKAALFLCSDESSYITGQILNVDGGLVTF
jgi:3-oxoacyl-[acyl-carrier protein] reductase